MKRTMRYLLPTLALLATVSCATYDRVAMQSAGDVAVISIQCNRLVATGDDKEWAATAKVWAGSDAFDLAPSAARISTDLFGAYMRSLPFKLVGERTLLDSEAYQGLGSGGIKLLPAKEVTVPTGYLPLSLDNRKGIDEVIARFPEVNGFLWAEVTYTLVKKNNFHGTSDAAMGADLTLTILDRRGRGILRHTESAEDDVELRVISIGMLRMPDVVSAAARATARVSAKMARWLQARNAP
jgi:hypothetical protein